MKNIKITVVQYEIMHNGVTYLMCPTPNIKSTARQKELFGYKTILATMKIHKSLVGVNDLHGNPYKGSQYLYVSTNRF